MYNKAGEDIVVMAQTLEKLFLTKIATMPKDEVEVPINAPETQSPAATPTQNATPAAAKEGGKEKVSENMGGILNFYHFLSISG